MKFSAKIQSFLSFPARDCSRSFVTLGTLKTHVVNNHVSYLSDFLKKFLKGLCIKDCLIKASTNSDEEIVVIDQTVEKSSSLLEKYLKYSREHNFDPWACQVFKINGFINYAYSTLKFRYWFLARKFKFLKLFSKFDTDFFLHLARKS